MKKVNIMKTTLFREPRIIKAIILLLVAFHANAQIDGWNPEL